MTDTPHIDNEQQRLIELLRSFDDPAPESLHRSIESLVASRRSSSGRSTRLRLAGVCATAAAAVVLAIALVSTGSRSSIGFGQAASTTLRAATLPAPPESRAHHGELDVAVDGVSFPYWDESFGWRSTGSRTDRIEGRSITTVFYANSAGDRIGYAILAGAPVSHIAGGAVVQREGVSYRLLDESGAPTVTWLRDGHLCVISGRDVSNATLLRLASWSDHDASAS